MGSEWERRIDALYASAGNREALASALAAFLPEFDAQKVGLITTPNVLRPGSYVVASHGIADENHVAYQTHFCTEDEWVRCIFERHPVQAGDVFLGNELVPADRLLRTRFWRDYCVPHQCLDVVGCVLEAPGQDSSPLTFLSYIRAQDATPIRADCKEHARALVPHVRRVLTLHRRLAPQLAAGQSIAELFERMALPMVFVDAAGHLVQANAAAQRLLDRGRLIRTAAPQGAVQACVGPRWQDLGALLVKLHEEPGFDLAIEEPADHEDLPRPLQVLTVQRVHAAFSDRLAEHRAHAVLSIRSVTLPLHGPLVRRHFGLTQTELEVARGLTEGLSAEAVARQLGVRITTVRTHIASLLAKTSSKRQSEVLRRLGALS